MRIHASELKGLALDWAVAQCQGVKLNSKLLARGVLVRKGMEGIIQPEGNYSPSTYWGQGGPIIGRMLQEMEEVAFWHKWKTEFREMDNPDLLIAAMRCYVASKLGDEVDVPDELR